MGVEKLRHSTFHSTNKFKFLIDAIVQNPRKIWTAVQVNIAYTDMVAGSFNFDF